MKNIFENMFGGGERKKEEDPIGNMTDREAKATRLREDFLRMKKSLNFNGDIQQATITNYGDSRNLQFQIEENGHVIAGNFSTSGYGHDKNTFTYFNIDNKKVSDEAALLYFKKYGELIKRKAQMDDTVDEIIHEESKRGLEWKKADEERKRKAEEEKKVEEDNKLISEAESEAIDIDRQRDARIKAEKEAQQELDAILQPQNTK